MSTNDELFPLDAVFMESPRLRWMKLHGIITCRVPNDTTWLAGFQGWWPDRSGLDFFAYETARNGDSRVAEGFSEDDALMELARGYRLPLWNAKGWE